MDKKVLTISSLVALLGLSTVLASTSARATSAPVTTVTICHATNSTTNPYLQQSPNADGDVSGHDGHNGPVYPNTLNGKWGDIIPPFTYQTCTGNGYHLDGSVCKKNSQPDQSPVIASYAGKNWTTDGQAVWNNGCNFPLPTATPTPTSVQPTATPTPTTALDCDGDGDAADQDEAKECAAATPTPTPILDCDRDGDANDEDEAEECAKTTPTVTPTPTVTQPTVTPTSVPTATPTPNNGSTGGGDGRSDGLSSCPSCTQAPQTQAVLGASTGPQQAVLGASTMASTGMFEENAMNISAVMGILLMSISAAYGKFYKKASFK